MRIRGGVAVRVSTIKDPHRVGAKPRIFKIMHDRPPRADSSTVSCPSTAEDSDRSSGPL